MKENIVELVDGLNKVNKLKPVSFTWKDGWSEDLEGVTQYGFGAQTTEAVDELLVEPFGTEDNLVRKAQFIFFSSDKRIGSFIEFWKWHKSIRFNRTFNKIN